ncbi:MAG: carbon-nitrogen hydrolase family protein [Flavobacteriaceae bacterium]|nr:carbon-nitrogen hydrolase family protein [Flavobacteriaceae bacterium]
MEHLLKVGLAQISPVWLDKQATIAKIMETIEKAAEQETELLVFGEGLLPGYPYWLAYTEGAAWDKKVNKEIHGHYIQNSIQPESGDLDDICALAAKYQMAIYLGTIERAKNRGGHSLYASLVFINASGKISSVHRKLQPTYDERLTWSQGDGHGLVTHSIKKFTAGGLNCWENWMPLARTALYGQGENLHVAVWPGSVHNTKDITRFIARESRSYVLSVSGLMKKTDIPADTPHYDLLMEKLPDELSNGGSCIAGPDGEWITPPVADAEAIIYTQLDYQRVLQERQNFDPVGHYSRPDVTRIIVNRERQSTVEFKD